MKLKELKSQKLLKSILNIFWAADFDKFNTKIKFTQLCNSQLFFCINQIKAYLSQIR
ncbi:unnamed protein product [Paramecium sonneborni]|uniref:Uncharacterized protein n=1 Tax=Paramecium sonneborni TaxID=65129 RepID=A0A8S1RV91_9CILI|nr:unnamed protein product [Paramecium sonneborni]